MKFYPRSWAKYPEAVPGTLKLLPPEYRFAALEADYNSMQDMLYGDVPTFETVIAAVRELEKRSIHYNNYISVYLPAILRCFRIAGFLFSKEGCYITQNEVNAVFDEQVRLCADTLKRKPKNTPGMTRTGWVHLRQRQLYSIQRPSVPLPVCWQSILFLYTICALPRKQFIRWTHGTKRSQTVLTICSY